MNGNISSKIVLRIEEVEDKVNERILSSDNQCR